MRLRREVGARRSRVGGQQLERLVLADEGHLRRSSALRLAIVQRALWSDAFELGTDRVVAWDRFVDVGVLNGRLRAGRLRGAPVARRRPFGDGLPDARPGPDAVDDGAGDGDAHGGDATGDTDSEAERGEHEQQQSGPEDETERWRCHEVASGSRARTLARKARPAKTPTAGLPAREDRAPAVAASQVLNGLSRQRRRGDATEGQPYVRAMARGVSAGECDKPSAARQR